MNWYPVFLTLHIFAALMFVGTVFFEVLILEGIRPQVSPRFMLAVERAIGNRARKIMPWVLLVLYGSGIGMVLNRYLPLLEHPFSSAFGIMLSLKILLALSVFCHMVGIVLLAKWMFYA